jgi:biopolymer transport protein ExbD
VQTTPPEQQKAITVTVDNTGTIFFDDLRVAEADLEGRLAGIKAAIAEPSLHLRADDRVPYGAVARVMAAIEHSGISKVSVLTENQ